LNRRSLIYNFVQQGTTEIWKSTDSGATWTKKKTIPNTVIVTMDCDHDAKHCLAGAEEGMIL
jgi:hypothetical protein